MTPMSTEPIMPAIGPATFCHLRLFQSILPPLRNKSAESLNTDPNDAKTKATHKWCGMALNINFQSGMRRIPTPKFFAKNGIIRNRNRTRSKNESSSVSRIFKANFAFSESPCWMQSRIASWKAQRPMQKAVDTPTSKPHKRMTMPISKPKTMPGTSKIMKIKGTGTIMRTAMPAPIRIAYLQSGLSGTMYRSTIWSKLLGSIRKAVIKIPRKTHAKT
mmetsp:Transcript_81904/g.208156  ORF Transcript_81904/g.208156 Transcript_81904/m.208156 type:complete len:218 (-) Transcript_81904:174-827(-)